MVFYLQKVPEDCVIMSNSRWECGETNIGGIWYNREFNECHLTQGGKYENSEGYMNDYGKRAKFERIYCDISEM